MGIGRKFFLLQSSTIQEMNTLTTSVCSNGLHEQKMTHHDKQIKKKTNPVSFWYVCVTCLIHYELNILVKKFACLYLCFLLVILRLKLIFSLLHLSNCNLCVPFLDNQRKQIIERLK